MSGTKDTQKKGFKKCHLKIKNGAYVAFPLANPASMTVKETYRSSDALFRHD